MAHWLSNVDLSSVYLMTKYGGSSVHSQFSEASCKSQSSNEPVNHFVGLHQLIGNQ